MNPVLFMKKQRGVHVKYDGVGGLLQFDQLALFRGLLIWTLFLAVDIRKSKFILKLVAWSAPEMKIS